MKIEKVEVQMERQLITNMIMDDRFLIEIAPLTKLKLFKTMYAKAVGRWVLEYFAQFRKAPKKHIQDIYLEHRASMQDEEAESVGEFLQSLSKAYDKTEEVHNVEYLVQLSVNYLKLRSLELARDDLEAAIAKGDTLTGEAVIAGYSKVAENSGVSTSMLYDPHSIADAFLIEDEVMFKFPGALGKVVGNVLRGDLVAFMAPPKRGKSFVLIYSTLQLMRASYNVVFFSLEMRQKQVVRRFWQGMTGLPIKDMENKQAFFVTDDPVDTQYKKWEIDFKVMKHDAAKMDNLEMDLQKQKLKYRGDCRIICSPMFTTSMDDIKSHLDNLQYYENFIPDAIVIDYADLLKPGKGAGSETRHQLNSIWMEMRNLAQTRNLLVMTASQTNRSGMNKDLDGSEAAEDFRKLAHVSILAGLNQTKAERDRGIMRVNSILNRDEAIHNDQAVVLQNLSCGRFYIDSKLRRDVDYDEKSAGGEDED